MISELNDDAHLVKLESLHCCTTELCIKCSQFTISESFTFFSC